MFFSHTHTVFSHAFFKKHLSDKILISERNTHTRKVCKSKIKHSDTHAHTQTTTHTQRPSMSGMLWNSLHPSPFSSFLSPRSLSSFSTSFSMSISVLHPQHANWIVLSVHLHRSLRPSPSPSLSFSVHRLSQHANPLSSPSFSLNTQTLTFRSGIWNLDRPSPALRPPPPYPPSTIDSPHVDHSPRPHSHSLLSPPSIQHHRAGEPSPFSPPGGGSAPSDLFLTSPTIISLIS